MDNAGGKAGETGAEMLSGWHLVTQDDIDLFGRVTRDPDPLHVDPAWASAHGPFPTTIAFGFLTLSMLTVFSHEAKPWPEGAYALNYGFDRVRFVAPVPVGARIRGRFVPLGEEPRADGSRLVRTRVTVEIEGETRPALVADWLGLFYPPGRQPTAER